MAGELLLPLDAALLLPELRCVPATSPRSLGVRPTPGLTLLGPGEWESGAAASWSKASL